MFAFLKTANVSNIEVVKFGSFSIGILTFLAFCSLLFSSTSAYLMSGSVKDPLGGATHYGVGTFIAGSSSKSSDVVWWSDLTTESVCSAPSSLKLKWANAHRLCAENGHFTVPQVTTGIQVMISLSIALSFLACSLSFSYHTKRAMFVVALSSFFAMIFSCVHFVLWTSQPLGVALQSPAGDFVPVWNEDGTPRLTLSPRVRMSFGVAYGLCIISFLLLLVATCLSYSVLQIPTRFFDTHDDDDDGTYGLGKL